MGKAAMHVGFCRPNLNVQRDMWKLLDILRGPTPDALGVEKGGVFPTSFTHPEVSG